MLVRYFMKNFILGMSLLTVCSVMAGDRLTDLFSSSHYRKIIDLDEANQINKIEDNILNVMSVVISFNEQDCIAEAMNLLPNGTNADRDFLNSLEFKKSDNGIRVMNLSINQIENTYFVQSDKTEMCQILSKAARFHEILYLSSLVPPKSMTQESLGIVDAIVQPIVMMIRYTSTSFFWVLGYGDESESVDHALDDISENAQQYGNKLNQFVGDRFTRNNSDEETDRGQWRRGIFNEGSGG